MAGWGDRPVVGYGLVDIVADHAHDGCATEAVSPVWVVRRERQVFAALIPAFASHLIRVSRYTTRMTKETNAVFVLRHATRRRPPVL